MANLNLPEIAAKVYELLEPLESDGRKRVVESAFALMGESSAIPSNMGSQRRMAVTPEAHSELALGTKSTRWMTQNQINERQLLEVFHFDNGNVEIIASDVPGDSNRSKTRNCYLLAGIRALLATDAPTFQDQVAVELCQHIQCYDSANNSNTRKAIGMSGSKQSGFTLTAPCLREAAEIIKQMAN